METENFSLRLLRGCIFPLDTCVLELLKSSTARKNALTKEKSLRELAAVITIQTQVRRYVTRKKYMLVKFGLVSLLCDERLSMVSSMELKVVKITKETIVNAVNTIIRAFRKKPIKSNVKEHKAAIKIQRMYRSCRNKTIFRYLKEFLRARESLDGYALIKSLNVRESKLCDKASPFRVRLRLGGKQFPPQVYYKIYVQSTIDVNAFAPRNYCNPTSKKDWYMRFENNGWRPVQNISEYSDEVFLNSTTKKQVSIVPTLRKQDRDKKRREKKISWMKQMYMEEEVEEILDWSEALDFEEYLRNWYGIASTMLE